VTVRLVPDPDSEPWLGGTVLRRVLLDDRWIGWVGDGRRWRGWGYGGRRWFACWRQDGDTAARWSSELDYPTRKAALTALLDHVNPPPGR
jgi:hypothetical protein